jgi:hypothetical protein
MPVFNLVLANGMLYGLRLPEKLKDETWRVFYNEPTSAENGVWYGKL